MSRRNEGQRKMAVPFKPKKFVGDRYMVVLAEEDNWINK